MAYEILTRAFLGQANRNLEGNYTGILLYALKNGACS